MSGSHILYRAYDAYGDLLYIGQTAQPGVRLRKHKDSKVWWDEVRTVEFEHHKTRDAAERAERAAIAAELPMYNVAHNRRDDDEQWVLEEYDESAEGDCTDADGAASAAVIGAILAEIHQNLSEAAL